MFAHQHVHLWRKYQFDFATDPNKFSPCPQPIKSPHAWTKWLEHTHWRPLPRAAPALTSAAPWLWNTKFSIMRKATSWPKICRASRSNSYELVNLWLHITQTTTSQLFFFLFVVVVVVVLLLLLLQDAVTKVAESSYQTVMKIELLTRVNKFSYPCIYVGRSPNI